MSDAEEKLKSRIAADMVALLVIAGVETVRFEVRDGDAVLLRIWGATEEGWREASGMQLS